MTGKIASRRVGVDVTRALDEVAFRAWPAERVEVLGPWRARFTRGVTRRANSVMPRPADRGDGLDAASQLESPPSEWRERIERVERLYREAGLAPRFQIAQGAVPSDLDALLESRGYEVEAAVSIQCASLDDLTAASTAGLGEPRAATCDVRMSDAWFEAAGNRGRFHEHPEVFAGILSRLGTRAGYAQVEFQREIVATGLAVHDGDWVGVFAMRTLEPFRRRGAGRALLAAIVAWAKRRGAARAYLQVERDNPGALALYAAAGFVEAYGYHYRCLG